APGTAAYVEWEAKQRAKGKDPRALERKQDAARGTGTKASSDRKDADDDALGSTPRIQRQQPRRQSRSQRRRRPDRPPDHRLPDAVRHRAPDHQGPRSPTARSTT